MTVWLVRESDGVACCPADQLSRLEHKETEQRMASTHSRTELKTARSTIDYLEKVVKEKNEKIAESVVRTLLDSP